MFARLYAELGPVGTGIDEVLAAKDTPSGVRRALLERQGPANRSLCQLTAGRCVPSPTFVIPQRCSN